MESINDFKFNKRDLNFLIKLKARDFKQQNIHNIFLNNKLKTTYLSANGNKEMPFPCVK